VVLRSGITYADVKAEPAGQSHRIHFRDGSLQVLPNSLIRSVRPGPTTWTHPVTPIEPPKTVIQPSVRTPELPTKPLQRTDRPVVAEGSKWGPIVKSAILPGWGQYSQGREVPGALYAIGSVLAFQNYWMYRQKHAAAQREYNDPVPVGAVATQTLTGSVTLSQAAGINLFYLSGIESRVYRLQSQGNAMVVIFGLIWGWNMLDAVYGGMPWEKRWFRSTASGHISGFNLNLQKKAIVASLSFAL